MLLAEIGWAQKQKDSLWEGLETEKYKAVISKYYTINRTAIRVKKCFANEKRIEEQVKTGGN